MPPPPSSNPGPPVVVLVVETTQHLAAHLQALLAQHPDAITVRTNSPTHGDLAGEVVAAVILVATDTPSRQPTRTSPGTPVVLFSDVQDETVILGALSGAAAGYLHADISSQELLAAIRRAAKGETIVDFGTGGRIAVRLAHTRAGQTALLDSWGLRPRERQVLESLLDGRTNREIAGNLNLGEETVKTHLRSLYRKLGARDRAQAIAITLRNRHT